MDDPGLDAEDHRAALAGLARLNALSLAGRPVARSIRAACPSPAELTLLDVATGSGDVAFDTVRRLRLAGYAVRVILTDRSELALQEAASRFAAHGFRVRTQVCDVTAEPLPACDVAMCSLFFHHLQDAETARVIAAMSFAAKQFCVVSDLERSWIGTLLTRIVPRLVTRSYVVHTDAVLSAKAAYTISELREIASGVGIRAARFERTYPCRQLVSWSPSENASGWRE